MKLIFKLISVALLVSFLGSCQAIVSIDRLTYHYQSAYVNHALIVKDLRAHSHVFTLEEREFLKRINGSINRLLQEAYTGHQSVDQALPILSHYYAIKGLYRAAIAVVEKRLDNFPLEVRERIERQIWDVKSFDEEVIYLLKKEGSVDSKILLSLVSIMARFAIAVI